MGERTPLRRSEAAFVDPAHDPFDVRFFETEVADRVAPGDGGDQLRGADFVASEREPETRALAPRDPRLWDDRIGDVGVEIDDQLALAAIALHQRRDAAVVQQLTVIDQQHPLAEAGDVGHVVRRQEDRDARTAIEIE